MGHKYDWEPMQLIIMDICRGLPGSDPQKALNKFLAMLPLIAQGLNHTLCNKLLLHGPLKQLVYEP